MYTVNKPQAISTQDIKFVNNQYCIQSQNNIKNIIETKTDQVAKYINRIVLKFAHPSIQFTDKPSANTEIAVWYLTPEHHVLECMIMITLGIIFCLIPEQYQPANGCQKQTNGTYEHFIQIIDCIIRYSMTIDYILHIYFKRVTGNNPSIKGLLWLLQPCAINHLFIVLSFYFPNYLQTPHTIALLLAYTFGTAGAVFNPDCADKIKPLELQHFWLQHIMVLIVPYWLFAINISAVSAAISVVSVMRAQAYFQFYQFGFLEIVSILSGMNINYTTTPPNIPLLHNFGKKYRSAAVCAFLIGQIISGYLLPSVVIFIFTSLNSMNEQEYCL